RMGGHATHDEREARATFAPELFEYWGKRDPVGLYEGYLVESSIDLETGKHVQTSARIRERNAQLLQKVEERIIAEVDHAADEAAASVRTTMPIPESAAKGVYAGLPGTEIVLQAQAE
ncbi:MAG: hypothetical protein ACREAC_23380, partial [Blastocatellia bacterium]